MKRSLVFLSLVNFSFADTLSVVQSDALISGFSGAFAGYIMLLFSIVGFRFAWVKMKRFISSLMRGGSTNIAPESIIVSTRYGSSKKPLKRQGRNRVVI